MKTRLLIISLVFSIVFVSLILFADAIGRGPLERLPLDNVTILDMDDSMTVRANELSIIKVDYHTNYPNTKYTILIQILNEKGETVLLNWIEGLQINLSDKPGSFVCGDKICYDQWSIDNPYICGDEICPNKYSSSKSLESSWVPTESGIYEIVAFAWESVDNPAALSPPFDIEVIVVNEKPEKNPVPTSIDNQNLIDAKKLLQIAYYENVNLGPLKINDVIVGFGIENDTMIMDVLYRYSTSSEMDIVKKKIRNIVGDEIEIEYIPYKESSSFIQNALVYHWNEYLHKNNIEFAPAYPSHGNNDDGIGNGTFLCSPLVAPNGTEFYIVSTVIVEPFLITDTFVDIEKPEFCRKTWKTDVILEEPDRVISLWLEMGQGKIPN